MMVNLGLVSARWSATSGGVSHVTHVPHWYTPAKHAATGQCTESVGRDLMYR